MGKFREYRVEWTESFCVTYEGGKAIVHRTIGKTEWNPPSRSVTKHDIAELRRRQEQFRRELAGKFSRDKAVDRKRRKAG